MAHAIGGIGTPVFIGENGIPKECNQNLTTGEYFCKFDYKYATYDGNSPGHYKPGSRWIDIPADDIRRKALTIGEPISVKGLNYKASEYHANIKPLIYTVQHDSLVHIALTEFTGTGGGDMVQLWRKIFNSSGTAEWRLVSRFTEKFGNANEVMCCQFMCKAGSQFIFVFYSGTVKHINDSSNCIGKYCYQPMSADEEAFCYLWNDPTKRAKKGFPGGVQITEFVLTGKGGTEDVPDEPPDDPTGGGEVPGGGEAPDPITTDPSVGHDNLNDIQPIYIKDSTTKACEQNSGSATRPVYVKNGCLVPCSKAIPDAADVNAIFNLIYPVGSVYVSIKDEHPSIGTWEKLASGRCLWTAESADQLGKLIDGVVPNPSLSGSCNEGGSHNHTITDNGHTHQDHTVSLSSSTAYGGAGEGKIGSKTTDTGSATTGIEINDGGSHTHTVSITVGSSKYSGTTVRPESIGVTMWKRTA